MEYLARHGFPTFDTGEVDEYLHHVLGHRSRTEKAQLPTQISVIGNVRINLKENRYGKRSI